MVDICGSSKLCVIRFAGEAKEFGERQPFFWSLLFQAINLVLYIYMLRLEGKSKINSLQIYTTWFFLPMTVLVILAGCLLIFYFPPDLVFFRSHLGI